MEKQTLDVMADKLSERMKGINNWIRSNPNTDPNFYEIMDCEVELGKLLSYENQYYQENGYPEKKNDDGTRNNESITRYSRTIQYVARNRLSYWNSRIS